MAEHLAYHSCHAEAVGLDCAQFFVRVKILVLIPDARAVEIQIHSSHLVDESMQCVGRLRLCHVNLLVCDNALGLSHHLLQDIASSSSHAYAPSSHGKDFSHLISDTRSSTHHYSISPVCHSQLIITNLSKLFIYTAKLLTLLIISK